MIIRRAVVSDGERSKDKRQNKEHVGLNKADKEFEGHEEWQGHGGKIAGKESNHDKQDFTSKGVTKQTEA